MAKATRSAAPTFGDAFFVTLSFGQIMAEKQAILLFYCQHHRHLPPFHARRLLDLGLGIEIGFHPIKHLHTKLLVLQLPAAKAQRNLDLVTFVKERAHLAHLDLVIMIIDPRPQFYFFDFNDFLLFPRFGGTLLRLILIFSVVDDFRHRRVGIWRNLDEIEPCFRGNDNCLPGRNNPVIFTKMIYESNCRSENLFIDTRPLSRRGGGYWRTRDTNLLSTVAPNRLNPGNPNFRANLTPAKS